MSSCTEKTITIRDLLTRIHLEKYWTHFQEFGYNTVLDCAEINNEILQQIGIPFTGHRKRILKQLEVSFSIIKEDSGTSESLFVGKDDWAVSESHSGCCDQDPIMYNTSPDELQETIHTSLEMQTNITARTDNSLTKTEFAKSENQSSVSKDGDRPFLEGETNISAYQNSSCSGHTGIVSKGIKSTASTTMCENVTKDEKLVKQEAVSNVISDSLGINSFSSISCSLSEDLSVENEDLPLKKVEDVSDGTTQFFEFKGDMKVNQLYESIQDLSKEKLITSAPEPSLSFKLRNRPVPEIPGSLQDTVDHGSNLQQRRNVDILNIPHAESPTTPPQTTSTERKPSIISPYEETFFFNSPKVSQETFGREFPVTEESEEAASFNKSWNCYPSEDQEENEITFFQKNTIVLEEPSQESEYSTVEECAQRLRARHLEASTNQSLSHIRNQNEKFSSGNRMSSSLPFQAGGDPTDDHTTSVQNDSSISPYACFYGSSTKAIKTGWLDKLSPQGSYMFQKRWVKFDGDSLSYYNNEKEVYSKGVIPLSAITKVRMHGENKFEVITSHRTFVFRVEKDGDRNDWIRILQNALMSQPEASCTPTSITSDKNGYLELRGHKAKIFTVLHGNKMLLCKSEQDAKIGLAITKVPMNVASIKSSDRKCFEITTPFKSFSFTAESEREKQEWIEAVQQSIAETLSDYEVAEKIWFNEGNRSCADCQAPDPDWASINLCVVICKNCAGQHRSLGPKISKVRSLKMDANIWSNELVELFIVIGNKRANGFWEANLQSEKKLHMESSPEQRKTFIIQKYQEGRFRKKILISTPQQLNQALCAAVVKQEVLETMMLLFSGADVMCATGDPVHSTPYLLAKKAGQCLQMEFLYHNKFSDYPMCDPQFEREPHQDSSHSTFLCGFVYNTSSIAAKFLTEKKLKEEMNKWWCTLESGFLTYYENEKTTTPYGMIDIREVICLVVHKAEFFFNTGAIFTFEIYLPSEQVFFFGVESAESQRDWTQAVVKHFVPVLAEHLMETDYDLIGQLYYKDSYSIDQWKKGWFALDKSHLHYCPQENNNPDDFINLRRLQELTISTVVQNGDKINVLLLVEKGRTLYIHGHTKLDFLAWYTAIEKAASTTGNTLQDQQLSKNDVPIIVCSCIAFITQYGLGCKFIYLKSGNPSSVSELLENFKKDARNVKLRAGKHQLEDVTDVLKYFLAMIDDALLTKELYPYWTSALDIQDKTERVEKYGTFIQTLPSINKATLAALIEHLYRVQKCSEINQMNTLNLAKAFSSCLFQTKGQTGEEVRVIEDLIDNYVQLFQINEDQVKQMDIENSFITKWKDTQISRAGDLLIEVYVEKKEPDCCVILKVSPMMEAEELINGVLGIKNITSRKMDIWIVYEAIENGELERPLHNKEKVLEQVLQWSSLAEPGSAFLLVKRLADAIKQQFDHSSTDGGKAGYLKYKEEPSKFLSGSKFQERYFVLQERKLFLFKDMKSSKPEKVLPANSLKAYIGVKKRIKPVTSWGFTLYSEKYQWHLCCDGQETQLEWFVSILWAQNVKLESGKLKLSEQSTQEEHSLKQRISLLASCLERKEEVKQNRLKKHRSLSCLTDVTDVDSHASDVQQKNNMEPKSLKKLEDKSKQANLGACNKLPSNVIEELNTVLQKNRGLQEEQ